METSNKDELRIMAEKSIAKSFKGILRISHILEMMQNENDEFFNPSYYGRPKSLMNISGGKYESLETGYHNPLSGMDGTINRYSSNNSKIKSDDLRLQRVPMCDSMGNYLNWNIGLDGVTIGCDESINSNHIDLEDFKQQDITKTNNSDRIIWQKKYFPVLESGQIFIGLHSKDYPSDKFKVNKSAKGLIMQNSFENSKLIIENKYDKTTIAESFIINNKQFKEYQPNENAIFRTVYQDNKSTVEKFDVFMYRQDDYDCHNYEHYLKNTPSDDIKYRGNEEELGADKYIFTDTSTAIPTKKTIDSNVGIVNLKEYVFDMIGKYMKTSIVEVPTGTIINQFCSLDKWYSYPDYGLQDDLITDKSYPGHRPAMMAKRNTELISNKSSSSAQNPFLQSTIMGASKKINKLINADYNFSDEEQNSNLVYTPTGYYNEIIPLYKRDYVLCDGSLYSICLFPKNLATEAYPNRRESFDRFIDLFFSIGYQYTSRNDYVKKRFAYEWSDLHNSYKIIRKTATEEDIKNKTHLVTSENCIKLYDESSPNGNTLGEGYPKVGNYPPSFYEDRHATFVEDFITILAFEALYNKYSEAQNVQFQWTTEQIQDWLKTVEIPEKYRLTSFLGEINTKIANSDYIDRTDYGKYINDAKEGNFVMDLPYYNFVFNHEDGEDKKFTGDRKTPIVALGREIVTFNSPIKFWDENENKWVIIEAYKLPQIQHFIDFFSVYPGTDFLAQILTIFHQYNFQVPNLCGTTPTFIGSSGLQWADNQFNKLRKIESWSSSYSQKNYMHRHFVFVEPSEINPSNNIESIINGSYSETRNGVDEYKPVSTASSSTTVASAACWGGEVICNTAPEITQVFEFDNGDNPNYIWNELGKDNVATNMTILNEPQVVNGMIYPIFQTEGDTDNYHFWPTGDYRPTTNISKNDLQTVENTKITISGNNEELMMSDEIWNRNDISDFGNIFNKEKHLYDKSHWFGWEHYEDPRFDSLEPNRGRTSFPVNSSSLHSNISTIRYNKNKENYNITQSASSSAEWFSPENIKMLPLIKL